MSVYLVTAREVGRVKIGCADDPYDRLSTLQSSSPVELTLEGLMVGSYAEERALHVRFAEHRIRREWFTITAEIELLIATFPAPVKGRPTWSQRMHIRKAMQPPKPSQEELDQARTEKARKYLQQREQRGDICFPFRATEAA